MLASNLIQTAYRLNTKNTNFKLYGAVYRNLTSQQTARSGARRSFRSTFNDAKTVINKAAAASGSGTAAFPIGRSFVAGGALLGLGSLAYYGLGFSNEVGILDKSVAWPQYVRDRVHTTYQYFGASLAVTAASVVACARSPVIMNFMMKGSFVSIFATFAAVVASGMLVRSLPYEQGKFGSKQMAWLLYSGFLGAMVAPMTLMGGPLLMRAALYTAGVVGGLSVVAATAPSEKFLNMGGPLAVGFGVLFAASIGSVFLPPTTRIGLSLYSLSVYGGLVLFSMFLLYDTQKIVHRAEMEPHFDPVNHSMSIYMDTLNIFMRLAMIMSGNRRK